MTFKNQTGMANFEFFNKADANDFFDFDPQLTSLAETRNKDNFESELNQLNQCYCFQKFGTPTGCPPPNYLKLWFPSRDL